jgi:hypothetical protein
LILGRCHQKLYWLKIQCHEEDICFKGLKILTSTFCVCADGFQGLSKAFHCPAQLLPFLFTSLKLPRYTVPLTDNRLYGWLRREGMLLYTAQQMRWQRRLLFLQLAPDSDWCAPAVVKL